WKCHAVSAYPDSNPTAATPSFAEADGAEKSEPSGDPEETPRRVNAAAFIRRRTEACALLLYNSKAVDVHFEHVIDANAGEAVGLLGHPGFRRRMHDGAIHHVVDLVRLHTDFELVDRGSVRAGFLHRIARRLARNGRRVGIAVATLQQPGTVLRDGKVDVLL